MASIGKKHLVVAALLLLVQAETAGTGHCWTQTGIGLMAGLQKSEALGNPAAGDPVTEAVKALIGSKWAMVVGANAVEDCPGGSSANATAQGPTCSPDRMDLCNDAASCHGLNLTSYAAGAIASWKNAKCERCSKFETWKCGQEACLKLTLDNNNTPTWKDNDCKKCGPCDRNGCTTKESCETQFAPCSHWDNSTVVSWDASQMVPQCRVCSKDSTHQCTQESCSKLKLDNNATAAWVMGSCRRCKDCENDGCITKESCEAVKCSHWDNSTVIAWDASKAADPKGQPCTRCSKDSTHQCTQATCSQLKFDNGVTAAWADNSCKKCGDCQMDGCVTKESCESYNCSHQTGISWDASKSKCVQCNKDNSWDCPEQKCLQLKLDNGAVPVFAEGRCQKCGNCDMGGCRTKASCDSFKCSSLGEGVTVSWNADDNRCGKCGDGDTSGCTTKTTCESQKTKDGGNYVWMANRRRARCRKCSKDDTSGCDQTTCAALKFDDSTVAVWKGGSCDGECRKCNGCEPHGCATKATCDAASKQKCSHRSSGKAMWDVSQQECRWCSKDDPSGCDEVECGKLQMDQGKVAQWFMGRCQVCGDGNHWGCNKAQCATVKMDTGTTANWIVSDGRCAKCGNGDMDGCTTKASCEAVKMSDGGSPSWVASEKRCRRCNKDDIGGCLTQATCEALSGKMSNKNTTTTWTCHGKCRKCGDGDTSGCDTEQKCLSHNSAGAGTCDTVYIWDKAKSKCGKCGPDSPDDCGKDKCETFNGQKPGVTLKWLAVGSAASKCMKCGDGDIEGCDTKALCDAATISWGTISWSASKSACLRCGLHDLSGCATKETCENTPTKEGGKGTWMGTFCQSGCSRDDYYMCYSKASCEGLGDAKIKWSGGSFASGATWGACKKCSTAKTLSDRDGCNAAETCRTYPQAVQAHCAVHTADCASHCKGKAESCARIGLNEAGQPLPLDENGNVAGVAKPTVETVTETSFDVKVKVTKAATFDDTKYLQKLAEESGVEAAAVEITKKEFVVEVGFKFTADKPVTKEHAIKAIAKAWGVAESDVEVIINALGGRRLDSVMPEFIRRRLATDTSVTAKLKTTNASQADLVKTASTQNTTTDAVAAQLKTIADVTITKTDVEKQPAVEVKVTTKVKSATAITKPDATKMASIATAAGGAGATAVLETTSWTETAKETVTSPGSYTAPEGAASKAPAGLSRLPTVLMMMGTLVLASLNLQ